MKFRLSLAAAAIVLGSCGGTAAANESSKAVDNADPAAPAYRPNR